MMTTSTMIARDELDSPSSSAFGPAAGTLRRSLRQINSFKNRLFRLPATPRLSRSKKVGRGEELTGWNFERAGSQSTSSNSQSNGNSFGAQSFSLRQQPMPTGMDRLPPLVSQSPDHNGHMAPIATMDETNFLSSRFPLACSSSPMFENGLPEGFVGGGSCRLSNESSAYSRRRQRPTLPSFNPPDANEARNTIHEHLRHLLPSPPPVSSAHAFSGNYEKNGDGPRLGQQYVFLPNTSYDPNGEMFSASWQTDESKGSRGNHQLGSPTQSTISLLNTQSNRVTMRSLSSSSASMSRRHHQQQRQSTSGRPTYQLNGLFHQPSLKSICTVPNHAASRTSILIRNDQEQLTFVETIR